MYLWWAALTYIAILLTGNLLTPNENMRFYLDILIDAGFLGPLKISIVSFYILNFIYSISLPLAAIIFKANIKVRREKAELLSTIDELLLNNTELELEYLKNQINPHFLFNTLNNIRCLVSKNDSAAEESIIQLNTIMYYLLHQSNRSLVTVEQEYAFLRNYLALEKLSLKDESLIDIKFYSDNDTDLIVPLIIFSFIENAIKHGPKSNKGAKVTADIKIVNTGMYMIISNDYKKKNKSVDHIGGIGLLNAQRRLELNYPGRYVLNIEDEEEKYTVVLQINQFAISEFLMMM